MTTTLQAKGVDIAFIADRVAQLLGMEEEQVWVPGKYKKQVAARSLLCFWAVRELGVSMTSLGQRLAISTAAVSKSVRRGAEIAKKEGFKLL